MSELNEYQKKVKKVKLELMDSLKNIPKFESANTKCILYDTCIKKAMNDLQDI